MFWAQDPGSLGSIESQLAELPSDVTSGSIARFRDSEGRWVGTSGRVRTLVYDTDALTEDELPSSVFELTGRDVERTGSGSRRRMRRSRRS